MYYHPVRVAWIIWGLGWTAFWCAAAAYVFPHRACTETLFLRGCMIYGTRGNVLLTLLFIILAAASVVTCFLPVGPGKISPTP